MSRDDFMALTPAEFSEVATRWNEAEEARERAAWRRTRRLAAIIIRPHIKRAIPEEALIPLPGDKKKDPAPEKSKIATEDISEKRMAAFRSRVSML